MNEKNLIGGSIDYLRHLFISNAVKALLNMTKIERIALSDNCMHSPISNIDYVHNIVKIPENTSKPKGQKKK